MHGNVAEWCHDWYLSDYSESKPSAKGIERVVRDGHCFSVLNQCRSANRSRFDPNWAARGLGFGWCLVIDFNYTAASRIGLARSILSIRLGEFTAAHISLRC